jgi:hypothetical protein
MNLAYDWAFARPVRKVFYNLTITGVSVFAAFFIGTIEILGLISQEYDLTAEFWTFMANFDINKAGFVIVGIFILTWAIAGALAKSSDDGTLPPPRPTRTTSPRPAQAACPGRQTRSHRASCRTRVRAGLAPRGSVL